MTLFKIPEEFMSIPFNERLKREFLSRILQINKPALQETSYKLLDLVGNWFFICPGTKFEAPGSNHHDIEGGLVQHLLDVERTALSLAHERYESEPINTDILSFAALFHDIGKCFEFSYTGETLYASLGHVAISLMIVPRVMEETQTDRETILAVSHCFASHHQRISEGALVEPMTREAFILASANRLDANLWRLDDIESLGRPFIRGRECSRVFFSKQK